MTEKNSFSDDVRRFVSSLPDDAARRVIKDIGKKIMKESSKVMPNYPICPLEMVCKDDITYLVYNKDAIADMLAKLNALDK